MPHRADRGRGGRAPHPPRRLRDLFKLRVSTRSSSPPPRASISAACAPASAVFAAAHQGPRRHRRRHLRRQRAQSASSAAPTASCAAQKTAPWRLAASACPMPHRRLRGRLSRFALSRLGHQPLTGTLTLLTAVGYVAIYTPLKRSPPSTHSSARPWSPPPLIGWTAARGLIEWPASPSSPCSSSGSSPTSWPSAGCTRDYAAPASASPHLADPATPRAPPSSRPSSTPR